jgi:hypothetical protein
MCCGQGATCGLTDRQVLEASRVLAEVFGSPRAAARLRVESSWWATKIRESREAAAYWRATFDCGADVLARRGTTEEYLACDWRE